MMILFSDVVIHEKKSLSKIDVVVNYFTVLYMKIVFYMMCDNCILYISSIQLIFIENIFSLIFDVVRVGENLVLIYFLSFFL